MDMGKDMDMAKAMDMDMAIDPGPWYCARCGYGYDYV